jgi:hypothetical protein
VFRKPVTEEMCGERNLFGDENKYMYPQTKLYNIPYISNRNKVLLLHSYYLKNFNAKKI